jgi:rare lipoprotein A
MSPISTGQSAHACLRAAMIASLAGIVAACAPALKREPPAPAIAPPPIAAPPGGAPRPGGYYLDDGPGANPPDNLDAIPDALPRLEPLHRFANRPYTVFGRDYVPATTLTSYRERGLASWYGR